MLMNTMQTKSLIEAKIIPVYDLNSEHSEFSLTISLSTKLILFIRQTVLGRLKTGREV